MNYLADNLLRQKAIIDMPVRMARRVDRNAFEVVINRQLAGVAPQARLAVARSLGYDTSGLIIGGVLDTSTRTRGAGAMTKSPAEASSGSRPVSGPRDAGATADKPGRQRGPRDTRSQKKPQKKPGGYAPTPNKTMPQPY